jgi:hypothetical protein
VPSLLLELLPALWLVGWRILLWAPAVKEELLASQRVLHRQHFESSRVG